MPVQDKDYELLSVIHKGSMLSLVGSSIYLFYSIFIQQDLLNVITSVPFVLVFMVEAVFYRLKMIEPLKLLLVLSLPLLVSLETLFIGGDFSQPAALIASLVITYNFFGGRRKRMYAIGLVNIISYVAVLLYLQFEEPLFKLKDDPYDEIVVFLVSVCWLFLILEKHDRDEKLLIGNLERKNESLKKATEELERFANIASHDLKSPLRNIASFLGLIERNFKRGDTSNLLTNLEFAKSAATQMHFLVESILEISKVNQDANPHKEVADLNALLKNALNNLHQDILDKKASVKVDTLPHYYCNPFEMTLLFQNFIENAIKYNQSEKPVVEVKATDEKDALRIAITDNGIGIDQQYHEYIFDHFKRLHSSSQYAGTGLGLSLCKKIVQKHDGSIKVNSALGEGSTFTVVLPKKH
jgi:signal transduction histidine kinase